MPYTPNNPYIPGDPYSYDLKWVVDRIKNLKSEIIRLEKTYTTPTVVDTAAEFTDINKIYVYVGSELGYNNGHWYYYDPDTNLWTDGGIYGSIAPDVALDITSTNAVENKAITTAINTTNNNLSSLAAIVSGKQDALSFPLSLANGGTGSDNADVARQNLGAMQNSPTLLYDGGKVTSGTVTLSDSLYLYSWYLAICVTNVNFVTTFIPYSEFISGYNQLLINATAGNWVAASNCFEFNSHLNLTPVDDTHISVASISNDNNFQLGLYRIYGFK